MSGIVPSSSPVAAQRISPRIRVRNLVHVSGKWYANLCPCTSIRVRCGGRRDTDGWTGLPDAPFPPAGGARWPAGAALYGFRQGIPAEGTVRRSEEHTSE